MRHEPGKKCEINMNNGWHPAQVSNLLRIWRLEEIVDPLDERVAIAKIGNSIIRIPSTIMNGKQTKLEG